MVTLVVSVPPASSLEVRGSGGDGPVSALDDG